MPSLSARLFGLFLRSTKSIIKQFSGGPGMDAVIAAARRVPQPVPTPKMRATLDVREEQFEGRSVWHLAPKGRAPAGHLLFFHGGGYVFGAAAPHWTALAELAGKYGIAVTAPLYPLAPEAGVEETTGFALAYYRHYLESHAWPFAIGGDSAGAGLTSVTAMLARDAGLRLPSRILLISPWLDAAAVDPAQPAIEPRDAMLRLRGIRDAGKLYARTLPVSDWRVSPINGDWSGLPPISLWTGGDDILVTDARALRVKLPSISYEEQAGMMHDWPLLFFPESKAARAEMGALIAAG